MLERVRLHSAVEQGLRKLYAKECGYSISTVIKVQEKVPKKEPKVHVWGRKRNTSTARMIRD